MSNKTGDTKRGRGRPPIEKVKLKSSPRYAVEDYNKKYKNESVCCVYGIDEFTLLLLESLWLNPEILFYVTDPNPTILANVNRNFSQRSMSKLIMTLPSSSSLVSNS